MGPGPQNTNGTAAGAPKHKRNCGRGPKTQTELRSDIARTRAAELIERKFDFERVRCDHCSMEVLASGANFEITAERGVVRLTVVNRPEVDRDEGARCAQLMQDTLTSRVLLARSQYRALVIDVRQGPEVFGPKTRASLEELFRAAESARKRTAVRPGASPIRRLQFASLCRECAPRQAKIVDDDQDESAWLAV